MKQKILMNHMLWILFTFALWQQTSTLILRLIGGAFKLVQISTLCTPRSLEAVRFKRHYWRACKTFLTTKQYVIYFAGASSGAKTAFYAWWKKCFRFFLNIKKALLSSHRKRWTQFLVFRPGFDHGWFWFFVLIDQSFLCKCPSPPTANSELVFWCRGHCRILW